MQEQPAVTTFLFTDIEGSTRLWEEQPDRMRLALARHDALARSAVETRHGTVVKTTGDGLHAAFGDPLDAVGAAVALQQSIAEPEVEDGVALRVRCGVHVGVVERRDNDFFGSAVNRAARIMSAAHGGQVLVSQTVADLVAARLPAGLTLRDLGLARLRDLAQPERIYQVVHPALRDSFPALRSLEAIPNNLPQQVTSFIGRERELAAIRDLLRRGRLVTVVGTGGLGKTRLSLQVAADALDDFPDGAWLVELAPLADPQLVPQAVASVLGVKEELGRSVSQALIRHCGDRKLMLILDNCEHLIDACAALAAALLQSVPDLKILASSRERLNIRGETTYLLPPFVVPDPQGKPTIAELAQSDAVRLFIERAMAAQPSFRPTEQNAACIAAICYRLDGIPLAIELAAARARVVAVETIAARLDDRFRLLTGGDRAALPRQQTLRALIDWSYELLTQPERMLFRRLSVFAGGIALDAAEAVAAGDDLDRMDVLDVIARLVEKSLVMLDVDRARYRLLETVREYAAEWLESSGEGRTVRDRHLLYYVALTESTWPELFGPAQAKALARLDFERENLLAAHAWCDHADDGVELGVRLVHALKSYWINRGLAELFYRLAGEALARTRAGDRTISRSSALFDTGQIACWLGRYAEAQAHLDESLAIARALGDTKRIAAALQPLGMACLGQGDTGAARAHLEEALELAREQGDQHDLAAALNAMAQLHRTQNDLDAAVPLYEQVLHLARKIDDRESIALGLLNLAMAIVGRSGTRVPEMLLEVLAIADETGSKPAAQSVLEVSAGFAASRSEWERAARLFGAAETYAETTGFRRDPADEAFLAPLMANARRALGESTYPAAEAAGRALGYDDAKAQAGAWLARLARSPPTTRD
ncbi:MAG: tetratricopeptide repeat protein [Pseudomonadota bacterium]|nr:tetratricopeptide repeat protein [Pseudomonadota bacterium]